MARLYKTSPEQGSAELLLDGLEVAESIWSRGKGLLGRRDIDFNQGVWLKPGNNIHTFFMRFKIDCIFLNKKMEIHKIVSEVSPFRLIGPFWKSHSVIEVQSGFAQKKKLQAGDHLYVVS